MQRVVVLGSVGAGKSTVARQLSTRTGLPVVHLDRFFWRAGWTPAPRDDARRELAEAAAGQRWILDGKLPLGSRRRLGRALRARGHGRFP